MLMKYFDAYKLCLEKKLSNWYKSISYIISNESICSNFNNERHSFDRTGQHRYLHVWYDISHRNKIIFYEKILCWCLVNREIRKWLFSFMKRSWFFFYTYYKFYSRCLNLHEGYKGITFIILNYRFFKYFKIKFIIFDSLNNNIFG